jgi:predicted nucleotidyltransferase
MTHSIDALPPQVREQLHNVVAALQSVFGDDVEAVLVHGSAARGGYRPDESDVDVLAVLRTDASTKLAAIGPALMLARNAERIEVMLLRSDEVTGAADCFPLFYEDIARTSIVLAGKNPFIGVHVHDEHRRVRIEQELREARMRLRRIVTDMVDEPRFGRAVERKIKQLRAPLWALLRLRGDVVIDELRAVIDAAGLAYGVDTAPLWRAREAALPAYDTLTGLLDRAIADVDARGVGGGAA